MEKKYQTPRKKLVPEYQSQAIREEILKLINEKSGEYQELRAVFDPKNLKAEIRKIVTGQVEISLLKVVSAEVNDEWQRVMSSISKIVGEEIKIQLRKVDIPETLKEHFDSMMSENMKPIIKQSLKMSDAEIISRVKKRVTEMINLKTSTLSEINCSLRQMEAKSDEDYHKELENFEGDKKYLGYFKEVDNEK